MPTYLYKPECPIADEKGMVEKGEYYYWKSFHSESKWMMDGNKPVYIQYISDEMPPLRHMARQNDGYLYTSKKKFRDETRARGCIEIGNECATLLKPRKPKLPDKKERIEKIKHVIETLKSRQSSKERRSKGILKRWVGNGNI
jgi:hypothetical protein